MTIKRKMNVPGLENISSDSDSDDDFKPVKNFCWRNQIFSSDVIMIDDSEISDSDIDIISVEGITERKSSNEVWRNIIESDILDEGIKCIGLESGVVHRDVESYELPPRKRRENKRLRLSRNDKNRRNNKSRPHVFSRLGRRHGCKEVIGSKFRRLSEEDVICLSSSADELEITKVEPSTNMSCKYEAMIIENDSNINGSAKNSDSSESETDEDDSPQLDTWAKLIDHLNNDPFQIEYEDGRKMAARRIATELKEPKVDLIERCLIYLGVEKCRAFLEATKKIEENGGMPTKDGSRRRTPGGVFFTLIKSDRKVEILIKEQIFLDSDQVDDTNDSLWWRSLESFQYKRCAELRGVANYGRRKEFRSYTLMDLDYFQGIRDFRYRYIPMMSTFPVLPGHTSATTTVTVIDDDDTDSDDTDVVVKEPYRIVETRDRVTVHLSD